MSSSGDSDADPLRIIVGPTAAGKTALALALARQFDAAIISADSRQIYRGFDIGTGKPSATELRSAPHFGLSVADATDRWSASRFADAAAGWLSDARASGRSAVVVGGTGFWVSALVSPLSPMPGLDPPRRERLATFMAALSDEQLRAWCQQLDPEIAGKGPAQWRRAIEVALLSGTRISTWHGVAPRAAARAGRGPVRYLVLEPAKAALDERIAERVSAMYAAGWAAEVEHLMATVTSTAIAWKACGYQRIRDAIAAGHAPESVRDDIVMETRRYARRQRTWFRTQLTHGHVTRLDPGDVNALERAQAWWQGASNE